jgi:hypothetical protein
MTIGEIIPGCIIEWDDFELASGKKEPKLFVIVGAKPDCNYLGIRATSQKKWRDYQPSDDANYWYIPGGKTEWFDKDTWVLFAEPQEFNVAMFHKHADEGRIRHMKGSPLRHQLANEICNRMRKCTDVSEHYKSLLGPVRTPPQKLAG